MVWHGVMDGLVSVEHPDDAIAILIGRRYIVGGGDCLGAFLLGSGVSSHIPCRPHFVVVSSVLGPIGDIGVTIADDDEYVLGAGKGSLFCDERGLGGVDYARVVGAFAAGVCHRGATADAARGLHQAVSGGAFGGGLAQGRRGV
jgi:hypothetical protein